VDKNTTYRFDPIDVERMRLAARLTPGQRIQRMLDARELAVGLICGRLRRRYPGLPSRELNLKVLEETEERKGAQAAEWLQGIDDLSSGGFDMLA
jgi:hypothetical protein